MASPRKFSEKIALLNQREAEESARFEQIMKEVSDVTNRKAASTSTSPTSRSRGGSQDAAQPGTAPQQQAAAAAASTATTPGGRPLSVKSAGASPPQSGGKHLHISLGNQYGGSLPNVNQRAAQDSAAAQALAVHSYELKTALSNLEEYNQQQQQQQQQQQSVGQQSAAVAAAAAAAAVYQSQQHQPRERQAGLQERRSTGSVGPMRSRPIEKRHDTSPYSGVPYLSPPNPETWRRTNSDSALHQSANEACQAGQSMAGHRRGSDAYQQRGGHAGSGPDNRDGNLHHHHHHHHHHQAFIERPRSSCDMPRVPGINVHLSGTQPGAQIPIGNNTGSLPDLSNVHFPAPLHTPLDQEDHSSAGSPYSNSPQTSSPTTLSPTSLAQAGRLSLTQDHSPPSVQNHLSVPVNHRFLHSCKQGITLENNTSSSQQDVRISYTQQQQQQPQQVQQQPQSQSQNIPGSTSPSLQQTHPAAHSPGQHYVYQQQQQQQQQHSPVGPPSPNASQAQVHQQQSSPSQYTYQSSPQSSLTMYRNSQMVNRPSPQSSPSLTFQGSPLSYSNNISAPSSPTSHHGPPTLSLDPQDQNVYMNQVHADFEQFSMDWAQMMQQLEDSSYNLNAPLDEMDSPAAPQTMGPYIHSPSHTGAYSQSDILNVTSELGTADSDYFSSSTLQQLSYPTRTPTTTQQLTPQTPNTPTITLTDCSLGPDDLVSSDFAKDFGTSITGGFGQDLFPADDPLGQDLNSLRQEDINALRQDLDPLDLDELQRLANADMVISDPTTEADFRLEQR
ncbi:CREB-regulated transcription coactivator 1-like isoform X3 [Phymastichus coffea]|uniref:CREB-regulated transcription coactivator 1-like isoform X3 n=1 Tax=Phymastichus coffea TaxID=108790 RepID=UPI00273B5684|nr:CREB-regulated transcription coactivator 1-like isoform X3 [Phymastichus coffea]